MKLILAVLFVCATSASASSFNEVRSRVYAHPLELLPDYPGLGVVDFGKAIVARVGEIVDRSRATMADQDDFREPRPKLLHPRGACAEAVWKITKKTQYTGLFAKGTKVRAMVRFSSGTQDSVYTGTTRRLFGMAVKLFPTRDPDESVATANIFTLDQHGFEGSKRINFLFPDDGEREVYFTNVAPPKSALGRIANRFFARFDWMPENRPLYAVAETDQDGKRVRPVTPYELHFVARVNGNSEDHFAADFRDELLSYDSGDISFDLVLQDEGKIGTMKIGKPVVSSVCDLDLHFHHHPNKRELEQPAR